MLEEDPKTNRLVGSLVILYVHLSWRILTSMTLPNCGRRLSPTSTSNKQIWFYFWTRLTSSNKNWLRVFDLAIMLLRTAIERMTSKAPRCVSMFRYRCPSRRTDHSPALYRLTKKVWYVSSGLSSPIADHDQWRSCSEDTLQGEESVLLPLYHGNCEYKVNGWKVLDWTESRRTRSPLNTYWQTVNQLPPYQKQL